MGSMWTIAEVVHCNGGTDSMGESDAYDLRIFLYAMPMIFSILHF